jgi:hypothetical protein
LAPREKDLKRSPARRNLLPATLVAVACAIASPAPLAQTVSFTAGPAGVITDPTIPKVIDQATGRNRVFVNLLRTFDRPGEARPDILIVPGVNSVLPWTYAPVRVIRPSGAGTLSDVTRQYFGNGALPGTGSAPDLTVGDFNRDGKPDIFIAESGWDNFQVPGGPLPGDGLNMLLESAANGPYVDLSSMLPKDTGNMSVTSADVDGDGILDVLVVPTPRLLKGKADGTFDRVTSTLPDWIADFSKVQQRYSSARFVDVDNDSFPDLVLGRSRAGNNQAQSMVLLNDGRGDFSHRTPVILPLGTLGNNADVGKIAAIDANGDGYPDLLLLVDIDFTRYQLQLLINRGDGTFVDETLARLGPRAAVPGYGWDGVAVADLNGDGKPDFVLQTGYGGAKGPTDFAWINDGNGVFAPVALSTLPGNRVFRIVSADVNGDGVPDIVAFEYNVDGDIAYQTFLNTAVRTVPSEPVIANAVPGDAQATVSFAPPMHAGASPVTGYAATCHGGPDGGRVTATGTASPIMVTGLVNGVAYVCFVTAANARGAGMPSAGSTLLTPRGSLALAVSGNGASLFGSPVTFTATLSGAASATGTVTFRSFGAPIPGCGSRPLAAQVATCTTTTLAYGPHLIGAVYSGDGSNNATVSPAVAHTITGGIVTIDNFTAPTIAAGTHTVFYTAIKNVGTAPLDLGEITFTGPFALSLNTCGTTLVPGQSCTINIAYSPTAATSGGVLGTMRVTHSGANSPYVAALSGIVLFSNLLVVEYLDTLDFPNSPGGHFFYSSDPVEQAAVDAGAAGAFARTGRSFKTGGTAPVCRFYGSVTPGPNSHFFTVDVDECSALVAAQVTPRPTAVQQWNYEGIAYMTTPPALINGAVRCAAGTQPVYRAYNNAYPLSGPKNPWESNHRFSPVLADITALVAQGWRNEGIAFCTAQ